jgi:hypothetical protein
MDHLPLASVPGRWYFMAAPAARFVHLAGTDKNDWIVVVGGLVVDEALGPAGRCSTHDANSLEFVYSF